MVLSIAVFEDRLRLDVSPVAHAEISKNLKYLKNKKSRNKKIIKSTIWVPALPLQMGQPFDNQVARFFKFYLSMNSVVKVSCPLSCSLVSEDYQI